MKELDIFSRHQNRKPAGIERVQPRKCCAFPHEGCTPSEEYKEYVQKTEAKKGFWQRKLEELQGKGKERA